MVQLPGWGRQIELLALAIFLAATIGLAVLLWKPGVIQVPMRFILGRFHGGLATPDRGPLPAHFMDGVGLAARHRRARSARTLPSVGVWTLELAPISRLSRGLDLEPGSMEAC